LQQEYFHTPKAWKSDDHANRKRMIETSVCFHGNSSKDNIHKFPFFFRKKRYEHVLNIKKIITIRIIDWNYRFSLWCCGAI